MLVCSVIYYGRIIIYRYCALECENLGNLRERGKLQENSGNLGKLGRTQKT